MKVQSEQENPDYSMKSGLVTAANILVVLFELLNVISNCITKLLLQSTPLLMSDLRQPLSKVLMSTKGCDNFDMNNK